MMTRQIQCRCGAHVEVPPNPTGRVVCPGCAKVIPLTPPLPIPTYSPDDQGGAPRNPQPETVVHRCPSCGKPSRVQASFVGRQVRCPHCKAPGTVLDPAAPTPPPRPQAGADPESPPTPPPADQIGFATEKEAPLGGGEPEQEEPSTPNRRRRPTSGLQGRPPSPSGVHRRPASTSGRTRAMPRQGTSGVHARPSLESESGRGDKSLWLILGGGVIVLLFFLIAALVFLIKTGG